MKLLLISENFYPTLSSGGRLLTDLLTDLAGTGAEVSVVTSFSRYNTTAKAPAREAHQGVKINRVPSTHFSRHGTLGRLVNDVTLCLAIFFKVLMVPKVDVMMVLSTPPFLVFFVMLLRRLKRTPYIFVVMDVFPDMAVATGMMQPTSPLIRLWDRMMRAALRHSARIVVLGRCMQEVVRRKLAPAQRPIDIIHNWADGEAMTPVPPCDNRFLAAHPELRHKFVVQYSGNLGRFHDFKTMLDAAQQLQDEPEIRLVIIGDGARRQWLNDELRRRKLENVLLLPLQPQETLAHSLSAADVALVTLEQGTEGLCVPSKFYPVLAVARPVIAVMDPSAEVARVVAEERVGRVVRQGDVGALVAAVRSMHADREQTRAMGERAREAFERRFTRGRAVREYLRSLEQVVRDAA